MNHARQVHQVSRRLVWSCEIHPILNLQMMTDLLNCVVIESLSASHQAARPWFTKYTFGLGPRIRSETYQRIRSEFAGVIEMT